MDPPLLPPPIAKLRLMCSNGGHIVPRPRANSLCYTGGDNRIVSFHRHALTTLSSFVSHLSSALSLNFPFTLKYQLPLLPLDSLISLSSDDDLHILIDEHNRLSSSPSPAPSLIRVFVFPTNPDSGRPAIRHPKTESWFFDALKSAKIMQKGMEGETQDYSSGELTRACLSSGRESMVLETSSSFGSTSSSSSLKKLQPLNLSLFPFDSTDDMGPLSPRSPFDLTDDRIYDVFLSFRGEDTRPSFVSHLYTSLTYAGIHVFMDDHSLQWGDQISKSLQQSIENSTISVIIFSTNYANSRWCLQELEEIMECHRTIGQVVVPVFYGVDPSEVRHQTGMFGDAFKNLLKGIMSWKENQVMSWRKVLREAAGISGFVVIDSRNESEDIRNVVEHVTRLLDKTDLFIADHPVGVEARVKDMVKLLNTRKSKDVQLLGIWGMGGIGKTTIAKAIYNKIGRTFEGRSFLSNIREVCEQDTRQVYLQEQLLSDIHKTTNTKIYSIESGKLLLKERLCHKRILLVLDDVNKLDQLNALCGSREWFGPGSRIIITTRDKIILRGDRVDHVCEMTEMDESESVELFSWHAFKQAIPREDFAGLSRNVVAYSGGLPLALEVLGSYLFERGEAEWKSALEKLKRIPNDQVHKKLKISFDGLSDDTEKEIFLDIACYFIGMDRNDVIQILNGCGFFAEIGTSVLVERSLITVDKKNKLGMHDLLRDMGREIVREKSPKELEERSRLWFHEDVHDVLSKQTGTRAVEGLALKLPRINTISFSTEAFKKMKRLRLLQLAGVQLVGDFEYVSRDLRWLCWHGFPSTYTPTNFYQGSLVALELEYSNLKLVWNEAQL